MANVHRTGQRVLGRRVNELESLLEVSILIYISL